VLWALKSTSAIANSQRAACRGMFFITGSPSAYPNNCYSAYEVAKGTDPMTQEVLPEIQVATEAIESRIAITEGEVAQMKEGIAAKRELLRSLRKALITLNPKRTTLKRRSTGYQRKSATPASS